MKELNSFVYFTIYQFHNYNWICESALLGFSTLCFRGNPLKTA